MSGMKIGLKGTEVRKELGVLGWIPAKPVFSCFSNAIVECHLSQKDLSVDVFPMPVFMDLQVFYNSL